jgi:hypothetical protein
VMGLAGPIGLVLAAPLGEAVGVRGVFIAGGILAALICLAGFLSPRLMRIEDEPFASARPAVSTANGTLSIGERIAHQNEIMS